MRGLRADGGESALSQWSSSRRREPGGWCPERSCLDVDRGRGTLSHLVAIECSEPRQRRAGGCGTREVAQVIAGAGQGQPHSCTHAPVPKVRLNGTRRFLGKASSLANREIRIVENVTGNCDTSISA